jgi:peptide/nickel transport system permease protein
MSARTVILRRIAALLPLVVGITVLTFIISHAIPSDPVATQLGDQAADDPKVVAAFREKWGLDEPLPAQYGQYVANLAQGDLGTSITTGESVTSDLRRYLPATAELALTAALIAALIGIPLGVMAAVRHNRFTDHAVRVMSLLGMSSPAFWLAVLLLYVFYLRLGWLPGPGRLNPGQLPPPATTGFYTIDAALAGEWNTFASAVRHLILPAIVLAVGQIGLITRITRSGVLNVLSLNHVRTARAKGLPESRVIRKHILSNAWIPILTAVGIALGDVLAGAVLVETIFSWPGLGRYAFRAATSLDFPAIMGATLLITLIYLLVNLVTDLLYLVVDPRLRTSGQMG